MQAKRFLRRPEVVAKTGISATSIYYLEQKGEFPRHIMVTPRCAGWDEQAVESWMADRLTIQIQAAPGPDVSQRKTSRGRVSKKAKAAELVGDLV